MKKNTVKSLIALLIFAALTAVVIVIGLKAGLYAPAAPEEGAALSVGNWLPAILWFVTGLLAALTVISFARLPLRKPGLPAWLKLLIYGAAVVAFVTGLVLAASDLGVDINAIVIGLGVVGTCVAIGCEPLMYDLVGGLGFISGRDFEVGDIITIDGFRGTVTDIGLRTTCITDPGGNVKIMNNSAMKNILNRSNKPSRSISTIGIPYATDLEKLEAELPNLLARIRLSHPDVFKNDPVYLGVDELADSAVVLKFVAEVDENNIFSGCRILNHDLLLGFRKLGVECPFPQLDVHKS